MRAGNFRRTLNTAEFKKVLLLQSVHKISPLMWKDQLQQPRPRHPLIHLGEKIVATRGFFLRRVLLSSRTQPSFHACELTPSEQIFLHLIVTLINSASPRPTHHSALIQKNNSIGSSVTSVTSRPSQNWVILFGQERCFLPASIFSANEIFRCYNTRGAFFCRLRR
jgi:hypothetical protein